MLYFNYLFKKTLNQFFVIISILISLIWFSRATTFMKYVTENGVGIEKFLYLFVLILPWLLIFIIPVSIFISVIIVYNNLNKSNEITILKNSGLTKLKIAKPVIILSILVSILSFFITFYLMPYANKQLRIMRIDFINNYASLTFKPKTFETINNLTIYIKDRDENNNLYGIMLNDERSKKYSVTITAQIGNIVVRDNSAYLVMENGSVQRYNNSKKVSEILYFDSYVFNLTRDKNKDIDIIWKPSERYFDELINPKDDIDEKTKNKIRSEIHERIVYPLSSIILSLIAVSGVLYGHFSRRGNFKSIIFTALLGVLFIGLIIFCSELIENSAQNIPIIYGVVVFFTLISLFLLKERRVKVN